jgi:putative transposase/transposase-like zinc-binding protein
MASSGGLEVADIVRRFGPAFREKYQGQLSRAHLRTLGAIEDCRTAALGGHAYQCAECGARKIVYNSCRNRHCPKCQSLEKEEWLEQRRAELLPIPYFHVVFTVPEELNPLAVSHPKLLYSLLFHCASETLLEIAADPKHLGARIGILAVLHTWSQKLTLHPHVHCIVTGGGLSIDGDWWVGCRSDFFLPVRVLKKLFRGKLLAALKAAAGSGELPSTHLPDLDALYRKSWVVYCKPPFGSPEQVLAYLARYTYRVAISNSRLVRLEGEEVTFTWRDYADHDRMREMTLSGEEFLRRFLLHVLPDRFVRIRYYGLLANRNREKALALCRKVLPGPPARKVQKMGWQDRLQSLTGIDPMRCEVCGQKALRLVETMAPARAPRAPPR